MKYIAQSHFISESLNSVLDVVSDEVGDLGHHVRHRRGQDDAGAEARQDRQPKLRARRVRVPREHCSREFWWNFT